MEKGDTVLTNSKSAMISYFSSLGSKPFTLARRDASASKKCGFDTIRIYVMKIREICEDIIMFLTYQWCPETH